MNTMIPQQATGSERASGKALAAPRKPPFLWGVATSGYQVEGFNNPSEDHTQWATWPVVTPVGEATGFYTRNKYLEDVALAGSSGFCSSQGQPFEGLHAKAFRISIDWARVQPTRDAPFDFSFYVRLINKIRDEGMEPVVTLLHSTYPGWLKDELGWDKPGQLFPPRLPPAVKLYLNFVQAAVNRFNDSVRYWITFNEPNTWVLLGWLLGLEAPGMKDLSKAIQVASNVIMAHRQAYDLIHRIYGDLWSSNKRAQVSANIYCLGFQPLPKVFEQRTFEADWVYPAIIDKVDFVSLDYYWRFSTLTQFLAVFQYPWSWPSDPQGLYDVVMEYWNKYRKPILIAENGMATYNGQPRDDGLARSVHLTQHVDKLLEARDRGGANVIGYLYWSITDNWEWGETDDRSGLYLIDYGTLERTPAPDPDGKTYAVDAYRRIIQNNP